MTYRQVLVTYTERYPWHILTGTHEILTGDCDIYLEVLMTYNDEHT